MGPHLESRLESRVRAQVRVRSLGRNGLRRYCLRLWSRYADTRRVPLSILTQLGSFSRKRKGTERNSTGTLIILVCSRLCQWLQLIAMKPTFSVTCTVGAVALTW
jgi:hypothetical protein